MTVFNIVFVFLFLRTQAVEIDTFPLHIVHYNDFHARFEETSLQFPMCRNNDTQCLGGFARLYHEITTLVKAYPETLVLNAGDVFQGTYWYTLLKWNVTQKFINLLPNDVHAIGNHEFDDGVADLSRYIATLQAPVVAANIDISDVPLLQGIIKPHVVVTKNGRNIGVIGLITTETPIASKSENVKFLDPIPVVEREAKLLKDKGVDIIIVLSHCGLDVDKEIAKTVGENIDVIVGGHTHSLLWNGESPSKEKVAGPYPILVEATQGCDHQVIIVTASSFTKYLGNITVFFDKSGEVVDFEGSPIFLNRSIPEDPAILSLLQPYKKKLHSLVDEEIGYSNQILSDYNCSAHECILGNIVADGFWRATVAKYPTNLTTIAFLLRNNIRSPLPSGKLTRATALNIFPFSNELIALEIQGRYILEALRKCFSKSYNGVPFSGPWVPQFSGMRITVNTTLPRNVASVLVKRGDVYRPLDPDEVYQLATLDYFLMGGAGFTMLKENSRNPKHVGKMLKVFEDIIKEISPIDESQHSLDGRLKLIE